MSSIATRSQSGGEIAPGVPAWPEPPTPGLSAAGDPAQNWCGRNNAESRGQTDGGKRTLQEGGGHATPADGRHGGRAARSNDLQRPGHEEIHRGGDRNRLRRTVDTTRPRFEDRCPRLRRLRCRHRARARARPASAPGIAPGVDRGGTD